MKSHGYLTDDCSYNIYTSRIPNSQTNDHKCVVSCNLFYMGIYIVTDFFLCAACLASHGMVALSFDGVLG